MALFPVSIFVFKKGEKKYVLFIWWNDSWENVCKKFCNANLYWWDNYKGFHFEYVAEIHIQEVGTTMIRTENFLDLMSPVEFFKNKHSNLISEEALEKFKREMKGKYLT